MNTVMLVKAAGLSYYRAEGRKVARMRRRGETARTRPGKSLLAAWEGG